MCITDFYMNNSPKIKKVHSRRKLIFKSVTNASKFSELSLPGDGGARKLGHGVHGDRVHGRLSGQLRGLPRHQRRRRLRALHAPADPLVSPPNFELTLLSGCSESAGKFRHKIFMSHMSLCSDAINHVNWSKNFTTFWNLKLSPICPFLIEIRLPKLSS